MGYNGTVLVPDLVAVPLTKCNDKDWVATPSSAWQLRSHSSRFVGVSPFCHACAVISITQDLEGNTPPTEEEEMLAIMDDLTYDIARSMRSPTYR